MRAVELLRILSAQLKPLPATGHVGDGVDDVNDGDEGNS